MSLNAFERFVERHPERYSIDYLSRNKNITPNFIEKHLSGIGGKPWNMDYLSVNPNITPEFIEKYLSGIGGKPWNMDSLSWNPIITPEFIEKYLSGIGGKPWNIDHLSSNRSITPEFIERHIDWNWDVYSLSSSNPNITLEFIEKYPDGLRGEPWFIGNFLHRNPKINITLKLVEKHLNWNWGDSDFFEKLFDKTIKKEKIMLNFLLGEEDKNSSLYNFKNNILFDKNLNKLISDFF